MGIFKYAAIAASGSTFCVRRNNPQMLIFKCNLIIKSPFLSNIYSDTQGGSRFPRLMSIIPQITAIDKHYLFNAIDFLTVCTLIFSCCCSKFPKLIDNSAISHVSQDLKMEKKGQKSWVHSENRA